MTETITNKKQLLELMRNNAIVITPNNRLTLQLLNNYIETTANTVVAKPRCWSYQSFLRHLYHTLCHSTPNFHHPILLNEQQIRLIWQMLLIRELDEQYTPGLILEIINSWSHCTLWNIDANHPSFTQNRQTELFSHWWQQFNNQLIEFDGITTEQLVPYLIYNKISIAENILIWVCFDDFTPQQWALKDYLDTLGIQQYHADFLQTSTQVSLFEAQDEHDENQQIIQWIIDRLEQRQSRIGVIVPDLQTQAKALNRLLLQHFDEKIFNISLGQALSDYPLVAHALCWLDLNLNQLSQHQASLILRSPYLIQSKSELESRAQLLQDNHVLRERLIPFPLLLNELKNKCPKLAQSLSLLTPYPQLASPDCWAELFQERLALLQFPGEYPLNSENYQCYQRFILLLEEFKQFALITPEMDSQQALYTLNDLAQTTIFQAQKSTASIHILGLLESAGCQFDSLWVKGLTDEQLPKKTHLSAFIPINLQHDKQMPHAHPARELMLAKKTLDRFKNASQNCVLSYPRLTKDKPNMASPLLHNLSKYSKLDASIKNKKTKRISYFESYKLPVVINGPIKGGSSLLSDQAKCPFRAFAAHRLHAKTFTAASDGLNPKEKGQLIHKIMELLWQQIKNQNNLLTMPLQQLNEIIEQIITQTLQPYQTTRPLSFSPPIQVVEFDRLKRLIQAALDWEKQRPDFSVEALEKSFTLHLRGIDIHLRVDRIDRLQSNQQWIIDYKSSIPPSLPWREERPSEPQLLLYALLDENIDTLLFAELKNGKLSCKGYSAEKHSLAGLTSIKEDQSWGEQRQQWLQQLENLVQEFIDGHCLPKPIKSSICQQCDFLSLCRFQAKSEEELVE